MSTKEKFTDEYRIRSYNTGSDGKTTIPALLNILEDIAGTHANLRGAGITKLLTAGKTWVLSRMEVKIYRRPVMGETIRGETWPSEARGLKAARDMRFIDESGALIMEAATIWLIIDLTTRRPVRVDDYMHLFNIRNEHVLEKDPRKLNFTLEEPETQEVKVPYSALDLNDHVNNVYYITRAMDEVTVVFRKERELKSLAVNFMAECFLGDKLKVANSLKENTLSQTVFRGPAEVCRISSEWT